MKKIGLAMAFVIAMLMPSIFTAHADQPVVNGHIDVTGTAEVRVVPDQVVINLGVESWNKSLSAAKSTNDDSITQILALAKSNDIDPKNIQTDYISVQPTYDPNNNVQRVITGYYVRKTVIITIKDTSKFETILTGALDAGANYVYGVDFQTTNLRTYKDQARSAAVKAAKEKADAMASDLGLKVGNATQISEDQLYAYVPYYNYYNGYSYGSLNGQSQQQNVIQNAGGSNGSGSSDSSDTANDSSTAFAPGQIVVDAKISVTFDLTN